MTIAEFLTALNAKFTTYTFFVERTGAKYTRVIQSTVGNKDSRSAYCFIDAEGNIYKPASWKTPAKGVRSTLATFNVNSADPFGGWLYR
jgi:hypothetical protein